jgi:hypothetical protein
MKKINILLMFITIMIVSANLIFAQQDYQIVQNFKATQQQIQDSIKSASSLEQLKQIHIQIDRFENEFIAHKSLLDKSLYPDNFNTTLEKLNKQLNLREQDYTQITTLLVQVSEMKIQIDSLNLKSAALINQIQQIQDENSKDKETIAKLEKSINELRFSLHRRDRLIMTMLDSLIPPSIVEGGKLTSTEKSEIYSKAKKNDIIYNIKKSINDNIKFLEVTTLNLDDIKAIQKQQKDFQKLWQGIGPQILDIYSERRQNVKNMKDIDSAFVTWHDAINLEVWSSIHKIFSNHGINLNEFSNGEEFTETLTTYIADEIKSASIDMEVSKKTYKTFVDSIWFVTIKPIWIPYLIQNKMLTNTESDTINIKISQWQSAVIPSPFNWLYVIIAVLVIIIVILLFRFNSSKKEKPKTDESTT